MNVTNLLTDQQNNAALSQLAAKLGISEEQARQVVSELSPALTRGMQLNAEKEGGLGSILDALASGKHSRYLDQPETLGQPETTDDGNSILGHIFGSKDVSRNVAKHASEQTGLATSLIKKALPIVATMVMASLGKKVFGGSSAPAPQAQSGGLLTSLLDSDRDGSVIDDVLGMAFKMAFR